jgi:hypothetical protein
MYQLYPTSKPPATVKFLYNCNTKSCGFPAFALWYSFIANTSGNSTPMTNSRRYGL